MHETQNKMLIFQMICQLDGEFHASTDLCTHDKKCPFFVHAFGAWLISIEN